jgi:L-rhamnose mutarotase
MIMASYAWVLGVRPGYEDEYKRRHDALWPEMDATLRKSGITSYTIFRHGLTLFGYFETDDLTGTIAYLRDDPVNKRWSEHMGPIMQIDIDSQTGFPFLLPQQWSLN